MVCNLAEHLLAIEFRSRKRFALNDYFTEMPDNRKLTMLDVQERVTVQRADGQPDEIDIIAKTKEGIVVTVEVRKRQEKTDVETVAELRDNADSYAKQHGTVVWPAFLSLGGFTEAAKAFCTTHSMGCAEQMVYIDLKLMKEADNRNYFATPAAKSTKILLIYANCPIYFFVISCCVLS